MLPPFSNVWRGEASRSSHRAVRSAYALMKTARYGDSLREKRERRLVTRVGIEPTAL
jgi:hypothetical protein